MATAAEAGLRAVSSYLMVETKELPLKARIIEVLAAKTLLPQAVITIVYSYRNVFAPPNTFLTYR